MLFLFSYCQFGGKEQTTFDVSVPAVVVSRWSVMITPWVTPLLTLPFRGVTGRLPDVYINSFSPGGRQLSYHLPWSTLSVCKSWRCAVRITTIQPSGTVSVDEECSVYIPLSICLAPEICDWLLFNTFTKLHWPSEIPRVFFKIEVSLGK